ncbi:phosphotransferase enzyme family protein [Glycomyces buryatensis]|uniref:phosphotransferase enzyme family protein n=1 Tax=Glycomyces buryatensis TaxID=2570927 RepID=UPI0014562B4B|nr:phosphotransferase [Glycomyces buryatensis]
MPPNQTDFAALTNAAASAALDAYDLPEPVDLRPIRLLNNAVYSVTTGDGSRFALRVHRPRGRPAQHTLAELTFLDAVHRQLAREGVRVPAPVVTSDGALSVSVELPQDAGTLWHCDLLTWVDGDVRRPGEGLGPSGVRELGRAHAQLHLASESFTPPAGFAVPHWDADALFTERSPYRPGPIDAFLSGEDRTDFDRVAELTAKVFADLGTGSEAFGLVHMDFILGNCHTVRTAHGWSIGVLDFDELGYGHFLYDLAPVMGNLSDYPHLRRLRASYLDGYRSVRPLPIELEAHLPVLMAARHAAQCLWAAGLVHSNGSADVDTADHIAYRMWEVRRCLAMR